MRVRGSPQVLSATALAALAGCGFFSPENPPHPLCGIWMGPFPNTVSSEADSARWVFTSAGIYLLYALEKDGSLVSREVGYYSTTGVLLTLSQEPGGGGNSEQLEYEVQGNTLTMAIRGGVFAYRRVGSPEEADDLSNALRRRAKRGLLWHGG
jgi:hypothetical protein